MRHLVLAQVHHGHPRHPAAPVARVVPGQRDQDRPVPGDASMVEGCEPEGLEVTVEGWLAWVHSMSIAPLARPSPALAPLLVTAA